MSLVDISSIKHDVSASLNIDFQKTIEIDDYSADLQLKGRLANLDEAKRSYKFEGKISGTIHRLCDRCLGELSLPYNEEVCEVFSNTDRDAILFEGDIIDFGELLASVVRADMPIQVLCSEDCKGLCSVCGGNLNRQDCGCLKECLNPVFDKLKIVIDYNKEV